MRIAVVTATITGRESMLAEAARGVWCQTVRPAMHLVGNGDGRREAHVLNELIDPADCDAYIVLNDDDFLLPTYVEKCVEKIGDADIVYAWPRVKNRNMAFNITELTPGGDIPITALIRKTLFAELGGYRSYDDGVRGEGADGNFYARALEAGVTFAHVPEKLWVYRFHGGNMSMRPRG